MKKIVSVVAVMVVVVGLCVGCGKAEKPEVEKVVPVNVEKTDAHSADDGVDHSGHNH